ARARLGRAASCTSTSPSAMATGIARRAASTESARSAPPVQLSTGLPRSVSQPGQCRSSAASATTTPATRGWSSTASNACCTSGFRARARYCLGVPPPKRDPLPAAGTTAQTAGCAPVTAGPRGSFDGLRCLRCPALDDPVKGLAGADHAQLAPRTLLHRRLAGLQVLDLGGQGVVALLQPGVLPPLRLDLLLQRVHRGTAAFARPEAVLQGRQQGNQQQYQDPGPAHGRGLSGAARRTRRGRRTSPRRPAAPRCAATGCTWPPGRCGTASRS